MFILKAWNYSVKLEDESRIAKAVAREIPVSPKKVVNLARVLKGMNLQEAKEYLERVIEKKEAVPYWRYHGKIAHKRGLGEKWGVPAGKYPVKAAKYLLKLLKNLEANAENKDLDTDRLRIIHIAVHKGATLKRYMPRAFGRSTPKFRKTSNVEVIAMEY